MLSSPVFHDIPQNNDIWFDMRAGKLTSSKLALVMATSTDYKILTMGKEGFAIADIKASKVYKERYAAKVEAESKLRDMKKNDVKKSFGQPAQQYAVTIAIEQITGRPIESTYTNEHMQRGHIQEPLARMAYEDETFTDVTNGGFFDLGFVGCSPDGKVGEPGVIEIKSVIEAVHYANVKRQNVDPAYKWQCIGNLKFTGSAWLDFISYCATYPEDKQLFVYRMNRSAYTKEFIEIDIRIAEFERLVEETKQGILKSSYINLEQ